MLSFTSSIIYPHKHSHKLKPVCYHQKKNLHQLGRQMFTCASSVMSNNNTRGHSLSEEAACSNISSVTRVHDHLNPLIISVDHISPTSDQQQQHPADHKIKKKRNLPGNPDPDAEVIALSPKTLMATNRFVCEICNKGFQRDQNLQLHRRGHNLPWKLKQRNSKDIKKKAYVCPESTCVHHHPSRALGDLTGIKKHFCRKHGEKKWKCDKCSKIYAVQSDWKAHSKTCGTREYRCDCGTLFSRKDSFITHRAFCDALAEETARLSAASNPNNNISTQSPFTILNSPNYPHNFTNPPLLPWENTNIIKSEIITLPPLSSPFYQEPSSPFQLHHVSKVAPHLSATALLQRAATVGSQPVGNMPSTMMMMDMGGCHVTSTGVSPAEYMGLSTWQKSDRLTRDFLGLTAAGKEHGGGGGDAGSVVDVNVNMNVRNLLTFTGGGFPTTYDRDHSLLLKPHGFGFAEPHSASGTSWGNC